MFARVSTLGLAAVTALSLSSDHTPGFSLNSRGAVSLTVTGTEAHYSISPDLVEGKRELAIALGVTGAEGALWLFTGADEPLQPGRYPVFYSWTEPGGVPRTGRRFHVCFMPGTAERPIGMFHSEYGWVTITEAAPGRIAGEFEVRARGFLASDTTNENRWVTVQGTFAAEGDGVIAAISSSQ